MKKIAEIKLYILIGMVCLLSLFFLSHQVLADTSSTAANVTATVSTNTPAVCGNGIIEAGEQCDGGSNCSVSCQNTGSSGGGGGSSVPIVTVLATSTTQTSAIIRWRAMSNLGIAGCQLSYGTSTLSRRTVLGLIDNGGVSGANILFFRNTIPTSNEPDLASGTWYDFDISCGDIANPAAVTINSGSFQTLPATANLILITEVSSTVEINTAVTTWSAKSVLPLFSCTYRYSNDAWATSRQASRIPLGDGQFTTTNIQSLFSDTRYDFVITCSDQGGNSTSTPGAFRTLPRLAPPEDTPLTAVGAERSVLLSWSAAPSFPDPVLYMLRRSPVGLTFSPRDSASGLLVTTTAALQYQESGLMENVRYYYTLFVFDAAGRSSAGAFAFATPTTLVDRVIDRDNDDIPDVEDSCDQNNLGQVDTPPGTIVEINGCPRIILDITDLRTTPPQFLWGSSQTFTGIGFLLSPTTTDNLWGLRPGRWYIDYPNDGIYFSVSPNGRVTWPTALNNTFSVTYAANGVATLVVRGYHILLNTTRLNPNGLLPGSRYRIYKQISARASTFLPAVGEVHLLPGSYASFLQTIAPFTVRTDGTITWDAAFDPVYLFQNNVFWVTGIPICVRQDNLVERYRVSGLTGVGPFVSGDNSYSLLPSFPTNFNVVFFASNPYVQPLIAQSRVVNFLLHTGPVRLQHPLTGQTGQQIDLSINNRTISVSIGACANVVQPVCGDGRVDPGEECDVGGTLVNESCSFCRSPRRLAICGNSIVEPTEECDNGTQNGRAGNQCGTTCLRVPITVCGNGIVESTEACDNGIQNGVLGNQCSLQCQGVLPSICGNGVLDIGEQCDDGNRRVGDGCGTSCQQEVNVLTDITVNTPGNTTNGGGGLPTPLNFFLARRTVSAELENGVLYSLVGDEFTVTLPTDRLTAMVDRVDLLFLANQFPLSLNAVNRTYEVSAEMPAVGQYQASIEIRYANGTVVNLPFTLASLPLGVVTDYQTGQTQFGAAVSLYLGNGQLWPGENYAQINPRVTDGTGAYGFVVPNGTYTLAATQSGFWRRSTFSFTVSRHVVNERLELIDNSDKTILGTINQFINRATQKISDVVKKITAIAKKIIQKVQEFVRDPMVQEINKKVVVPSVAALSLGAIIPSLWSTLLPLLRYLFLQPLLFFGKRKRESWGVVYNSLSKLPVELAIVRLVDVTTNKVKQSRVTDGKGRYIFLSEVGEFILEVKKQNYLFPTTVLAGATTDGNRLDIYHGEHIPVAEDGKPVTYNIPMDPTGVEKTVHRLMWERYARVAQHIISLFGIVTTAISFAITPTMYVGVFLVVHILLYGLFLKYVKPKVPKGWGKVFDKKNHTALGTVVVRLFAQPYNKLASMEVTNRAGRYAFLVGPNQYYATYEKAGYELGRSVEIDLRQNDTGGALIKEDMGLIQTTKKYEKTP